MNLQEIKTLINNSGINLETDGKTLSFTGDKENITPDLIQAIRKYKQDLIIWLNSGKGDLETEQQITNLIALGNDRQLAELIIWAWENDHTWPIKPFYLSVRDSNIPRYISDYKAFYHDIGLSLNGQGTMDKFELKHVLIALKELTTNVNMEFAS